MKRYQDQKFLELFHQFHRHYIYFRLVYLSQLKINIIKLS